MPATARVGPLNVATHDKTSRGAAGPTPQSRAPTLLVVRRAVTQPTEHSIRDDPEAGNLAYESDWAGSDAHVFIKKKIYILPCLVRDLTRDHVCSP